MKITKLFGAILLSSLLTTLSCRNDEPFQDLPKGEYADGIIIANEGQVGAPTATVEFLSADFSRQEKDIFSKNNNGDKLGNILQSIGFNGDLAYLVLNVPNKVEVVNRYTFKKVHTLTESLDNPRYITFNGNYTFISNNDFFGAKKVNVYSQAFGLVKSIPFPRYAEKIVSADNYVYVQSDGTTYASGSPAPTGHTISRISTAALTVDKEILIPDTLEITDLISDGRNVFVLTSANGNAKLYRISGANSDVEEIGLPTGIVPQKLSVDNGKLYYLTADNKVFGLNGTVSTELFQVTASYVYGFNVISGLVFISDPTFVSETPTKIYSLTGSVMKTLTTGISTNGFYRN